MRKLNFKMYLINIIGLNVPTKIISILFIKADSKLNYFPQSISVFQLLIRHSQVG